MHVAWSLCLAVLVVFSGCGPSKEDESNSPKESQKDQNEKSFEEANIGDTETESYDEHQTVRPLTDVELSNRKIDRRHPSRQSRGNHAAKKPQGMLNVMDAVYNPMNPKHWMFNPGMH